MIIQKPILFLINNGADTNFWFEDKVKCVWNPFGLPGYAGSIIGILMINTDSSRNGNHLVYPDIMKSFSKSI